MPIHKETLLRHDRPVPRYTSYPPATLFNGNCGAAHYQKALSEMPEGSAVSLYLHVPFCAKLCYYCGCFTSITQRQDRIESYMSRLMDEARMLAGLLPSGAQLRHVHFGGGSPSLLSVEQFQTLMQGLRRLFVFSPDAEIALEGDPRQLSEAKIATYAREGVNRMSFGVQDFDNKVLEAVNREQPLSLTWRALEWCRQYGITDVNFDLIYGLPHQTLASQSETLTAALAMNPSRFAFFGYAHVPWMKKHMKAVDMQALPDSALRYDLYMAGSSMLESAGYLPVGIDHFVRHDDPMHASFKQRLLHRNFQGYTTDRCDYLIGLGASAISEMPGSYLQNHADIAAYEAAIEAGKPATARGWQKSPLDRVCGSVIESIMCYHEADLSAFDVPAEIAETARARLAPLLADGLVEWSGNLLRVAPQARLVTRLVASAFDQYTPWPDSANITPQRHAAAV